MKKLAAFFFTLLIAVTLTAQNNGFDANYTKLIKCTNLKQHVYALASDSLEGRGTGQPGIDKAARYIAQQFEEVGLKPYNDSTYFQPLPLWRWHWGDCFIKINNKRLANFDEMVYLSYIPIETPKSAKCVFIGYGDNIGEMDLKGKIAFAFVKNLRSWYHLSEKLVSKEVSAIFIANPDNPDNFKAVKLHHKHFNSSRRIYTEKPSFAASEKKVFALKAESASLLFETPVDSLMKLKSFKDLKALPKPKITIQCPIITEKFTSDNVIGYLPGQTLGKETLVLTAHYDHIGATDEKYFPGADDNASGTAALIEIARALKTLPERPFKHVMFIATTAEEKGLLGAHYFVNHPEVHQFDLKASINIDMIGRRDSSHKNNYIYLIGTKQHPEFMDLHQQANLLVDSLQLDYTYDNQSGFGSFLNLSDHYAFHKKNIPVMAFFGGLHEDYHKTTDTPDKVDYTEMTNRVRLILATTYLAAQADAFDD